MDRLQGYSKIGNHEERFSVESSGDEADDASVLLYEKKPTYRQRRRVKPYLPWLIQGSSIFICLSLLIYTLSIYQHSHRRCLERFNAFSPVLAAINTDYQEQRFKYSLWYQSPFKGPPTPEVEQAWHEIMQYGQIRVTADDIIRIGHNLTSVQYPESVGGGYLATAMGTHAIHCLHYIWQDHYIDISPDIQTLKKDIPEMYERHYEHCVDYIRQELMCKFDTTIMPFSWVLDHQNPTPNGNTFHKCVNWDYLQAWLKKRAVEMPEGFKWQQPPDAVTLDWNP